MGLLRLLGLWLGLGLALPAGAQGFGEPAPWNGVRGDAAAISIAADGFIVAAGRDARLWTWRMSEAAWTPLGGEGTRVAALPGGRYFAIRRDGALTFFDGLRIASADLRALDVAVDGAGNVHAIRSDGALVRRPAGAAAWDVLGAVGGRRLALAQDGSVWVALAAGGVGRWMDGKLEPVPGTARELAVSSNGTVFAVDKDGTLQRRSQGSNAWEPEPAPPNLAAIAFDPQGLPWAARLNGAIVTRAVLPPGQAIRFEVSTAGEGGITFNKRSTRGGGTTASGASRALLRAAVTTVNNPIAQSTDPAPFEWTDTLVNASSLAIAGRDGSVFALDASGNLGRWSNAQRQFLAYPGAFLKVAVEADGNPWGINQFGRLFRRNVTEWRQVRGSASDFAIGVNGQIFATTSDGALFQYDRPSDGLLPLPGALPLFSVAVGPDGVPWALLKDGTVVRCPTSACQRFQKTARSLAVGPEGSVFIVTPDNVLWRLNKALTDWELIPVLGLKVASVAVGPRGRPWVITDTGRVFASAFFPRDESTDLLEASTTPPTPQGSGDVAPVLASPGAVGFVFSKSLTFQSIPTLPNTGGISLGPDGTVLMFSFQTFPIGLVRYNKAKNVFESVTGLPPGVNIRHAKVGPDGKMWIIDADFDGRIYHQVSGSNYEILQLPVPPTFFDGSANRSINIAPDGTVYAIDTAGTVYRRSVGASGFSKLISGSYKNLAITRPGDVWVIDNSDVVRQIVNGVAQRRPSNQDTTALDIAGSADGSLYITNIGLSGVNPMRWNVNSQAFDRVTQPADFVGVEPNGRPWIWFSDDPARILRAK
jgi:hypothetical protein